MKQDFKDFHAALAALDDDSVNPSHNPSLGQLADRGRRNLLKGGLGLTAIAFLGGGLAACRSATGRESLLGFEGIPPKLDPAFDGVEVAPGYNARVFFSWGDAVLADAPQWQPDASDDWQAQLKQAGDNHDGMHFSRFPTTPTAMACWRSTTNTSTRRCIPTACRWLTANDRWMRCARSRPPMASALSR